MKELYFVPSSWITDKIRVYLISDQWMTIEGVLYHQVTTRPPGWHVARRLVNPETEEKIIIFK